MKKHTYHLPWIAVFAVPASLCLLAPCGIAEESAPAAASAPASAAAAVPNATRILQAARNSYAAQNIDLEGSLRKGWDQTGFRLTMKNGKIQFRFEEPYQIIHLEQRNGAYVLHEIGKGGSAAVAKSRYAEAVRDTDMSYEDLSMRFLYWPGARLVGEEKISRYNCWLVAVKNPDGFGSYRNVNLWVDQRSGALVKMIGFDADGKKVRQFLLREVQQIRGTWMLKEMRVEKYDLETQKVASKTYLSILDPDKKKPSTFKKGR